MSAFPDTDPRDAAIHAARRVPREPWRHDHTWVRCSLQCCHTPRHHLADSTSLQLGAGKLASKGQMAQRGQAPCAVD
jgi:hypothetical protein